MEVYSDGLTHGIACIIERLLFTQAIGLIILNLKKKVSFLLSLSLLLLLLTITKTSRIDLLLLLTLNSIGSSVLAAELRELDGIVSNGSVCEADGPLGCTGPDMEHATLISDGSGHVTELVALV